jgi:NADPH oxidase
LVAVIDNRSRLKNTDGEKKLNLRRMDIIWVCRNINQLQWFANLLVTIQEDLKELGHPKFLHVHIYLTRAEGKDQVPVQLRGSTTFGRPSWDSILRNARNQMELGEYVDDVDRVGVYLCGGHALGKELAKTCRFYSNGKFSFPFKKEHF